MMRPLFVVFPFLLSISLFASEKESLKSNDKKSYSVYNSFEEVLNAKDAVYFEPVRISPVGSSEAPMYHGFFFYNCAQRELLEFDPEGRYMLGMRIFVEGRIVQSSDKGEIGYFDLVDNNKWIKIGETTAWNWQQGCRLQWIPGSSEEIIWNDRSDDGKKLISRVYNIRTKQTRTLPISVYTISPDGQTLLSVNFERIVHAGCRYMGVEDPYKKQWAPSEIGVWKMDMKTENVEMLMSVRDMAHILYPDGLPADTINGTLYFFREGFNPSGDRFIAFIKDARETEPGKTQARTEGFSMNLDGKDVKYLYREPSHHFWINDKEIMDNGYHPDPETGNRVRGYFRFLDDDTGVPKEKYFDAPNGHITLHKSGDWILTDTYNINGFIYLYMYHIPTKKFVPLGKLAYKLGGYLYPYNPGVLRVDLHPRFTPDGKQVAIDSSHEGFGRQMYLIDISPIVDNPPRN
ncbi:hypothetical protein [Maribellus maritimus]|uniref:hypothetical protein n=1 Tax=Maribellus maritimus TaxID=2870838 RepID=UPI001EEAA748|nr:hypothetical protein [Maribellus maritimus]MCG6188554.1 hypothetical protein [Maribellus maritimus]